MKVIIVGAGPCGLLLAVLLSKQGVQVQVLEASTELDDQPRACHYSAPAKFELERAGVLDSISAEGFFPRSVCWRKNHGSHIVGLNHEIEPESSVHRMVALELGRVVQILYNAATEQEGTEVLMGHRVTAVGQDDLSAWVEVALPSGQSDQFSADYIIGCDGGIADVGALYDALAGIHKGVADEQILTEYSEARSAKYRGYVDPLSTANFRRLWEKDPETTVAGDGFFQMVREAQADPDVAKKMLEGFMQLRSDLTQFYKGQE